MKKTFLIISIAALTAGAVFARGHKGAMGDEFGCGRGGRGGMMMDGGRDGCGMGMMGSWDEARFRDILKAKGLSDADAAKAVEIQKEKWALMEKYRESSMRQNMKERGMSDADINRMVQLQKDSQSLYQKYAAKAAK